MRESSLRNNELHVLQVVSSFLDNTYFGDDTRNCAIYKANKTLLPLHCGAEREWICKIPRGKNINKIFTICLLSTNLYSTFPSEEVQGSKMQAAWMTVPVTFMMNQLHHVAKKIYRRGMNKGDISALC